MGGHRLRCKRECWGSKGRAGALRNPQVLSGEGLETRFLTQVKALTGDFPIVGPATCPSHAAPAKLHDYSHVHCGIHPCLAGLARFEQDLHEHVHKENNLIFPRALAREAGRPMAALASELLVARQNLRDGFGVDLVRRLRTRQPTTLWLHSLPVTPLQR